MESAAMLFVMVSDMQRPYASDKVIGRGLSRLKQREVTSAQRMCSESESLLWINVPLRNCIFTDESTGTVFLTDSSQTASDRPSSSALLLLIISFYVPLKFSAYLVYFWLHQFESPTNVVDCILLQLGLIKASSCK